MSLTEDWRESRIIKCSMFSCRLSNCSLGAHASLSCHHRCFRQMQKKVYMRDWDPPPKKMISIGDGVIDVTPILFQLSQYGKCLLVSLFYAVIWRHPLPNSSRDVSYDGQWQVAEHFTQIIAHHWLKISHNFSKFSWSFHKTLPLLEVNNLTERPVISKLK